MDDVHFILRHAMTGAIFALFFYAGLYVVNPDFAKHLLDLPGGDWPAAAAALAIIGFPMIGITIQGAYFCVHSITSGEHWFADPAREYVAKKVRDAIDECCASDPRRNVAVDWQRLRDSPPDSFFVWLYHDRATPHMIEWARRRRSYYYLGWNWVIAAVAGLAAALLYGKVQLPLSLGIFIACILGMIWGAGALWAAEQMRHDADTMEAIWAASQIDPQFRDCLATLLPPKPSEAMLLTQMARRAKPARGPPHPVTHDATVPSQ